MSCSVSIPIHDSVHPHCYLTRGKVLQFGPLVYGYVDLNSQLSEPAIAFRKSFMLLSICLCMGEFMDTEKL